MPITISAPILKENEELCILDIAHNESFNEIVLAKKQSFKAKRMDEKFLQNHNFDESPKLSTLMEIVNYYNDIILIIKQLESLYVEEPDHSTLILSNLPNL